jgi:hypothetical protein
MEIKNKMDRSERKEKKNNSHYTKIKYYVFTNILPLESMKWF